MGASWSFGSCKPYGKPWKHWNQYTDLILPEEAWHVTDYYETTQAKLRHLERSVGSSCYKFNSTLPFGFCKSVPSRYVRVSESMFLSGPSPLYPSSPIDFKFVLLFGLTLETLIILKARKSGCNYSRRPSLSLLLRVALLETL
jgi:hypothetical protein